MKAAVLFEKGGMPRYTDFPEPVIENENQLLVTMKTAAVKHIDKARASGQHYSTKHDIHKAKIIGSDGIGMLEDGTRVYIIGEGGTLAEKVVVDKTRMVILPGDIDDVIAAALPNAVIGSAMALRFKAQIQQGETILINGATGFTGKIAVQIARYYGAKKIIVTGRNEQSLQALLALGADEIVSIKQDDDAFINQIKNIHSTTPVDIVIDYLWAHTAELILTALKGKGSFTHKTRYVSVGAVSGDIIQLSAEILRSVDLQLSGSGLGSWTKEEVQKLFSKILPEMFQLTADKKLHVDTVSVAFKDIENLWGMNVPDGKRLVVIM